MAGKKLADSKVQSVTFKRSATKDLVTGKVTYGAWDPKTGTFAKVDSPTIAGYTASPLTVDAETVDPDKTQNSTIQVIYTANKATIEFDFIDTQDNNKVVKNQIFTGKTDQTLNVNVDSIIEQLGATYSIDTSSIPESMTYKATPVVIPVNMTHKVITVDSSNPQGVDGLTKTITRTINYNAE